MTDPDDRQPLAPGTAVIVNKPIYNSINKVFDPGDIGILWPTPEDDDLWVLTNRKGQVRCEPLSMFLDWIARGDLEIPIIKIEIAGRNGIYKTELSELISRRLLAEYEKQKSLDLIYASILRNLTITIKEKA